MLCCWMDGEGARLTGAAGGGHSGGPGGWWMFAIPNSGVFGFRSASGMENLLEPGLFEELSHPTYAINYFSYRSWGWYHWSCLCRTAQIALAPAQVIPARRLSKRCHARVL
jgi:hypothetical protein